MINWKRYSNPQTELRGEIVVHFSKIAELKPYIALFPNTKITVGTGNWEEASGKYRGDSVFFSGGEELRYVRGRLLYRDEEGEAAVQPRGSASVHFKESRR